MHKPGDKYTDRGNKRAHRNPGESAPHNITSPENAKFADTVRSPKYPRYHGRQTPYSSRSTSDDPYRPESAPTSGRSSIVYSISSDSVRTGGEGHSDGSDSDDDSISNSRMRKLSPYISGSNSLSSEPSSTYDSSSDSDLDSSVFSARDTVDQSSLSSPLGSIQNSSSIDLDNSHKRIEKSLSGTDNSVSLSARTGPPSPSYASSSSSGSYHPPETRSSGSYLTSKSKSIRKHKRGRAVFDLLRRLVSPANGQRDAAPPTDRKPLS